MDATFGRSPQTAVGHATRPRTCRRDEDIRVQPVNARIAAKAGRNRMGLVDDEKRAVLRRQIAQPWWKPGAGRTMQEFVITEAGQDRRDVTACQRRLDAGKIIEFTRNRQRRKVRDLPDKPGARARRAFVQLHYRVVDGAVIAAVEDQNPGAARHRAGHAQRKPVGVRRGGGDRRGNRRTVRSEAARPSVLLGRQHVGQPVARLLADRLGDRLGGM